MNEQGPICYTGTVSGKVQGVFFRAEARENARRLGLTGWARNLRDGRVEFMVCGDRDPVETFVSWLHQGTPLSKVDEVRLTPAPYKQFSGFEILKDHD